MAITNVKSIFARNLFNNKVAIVTGGATGIGAAISHELCYLGCNVMMASRNQERLQLALEGMRKNKNLSGEVSYVKCNIRHESDVKSLVQTTLEKFGRIDFLVNNGGGQFISSAENISAKGWHAVVETNLTGPFSCSKQVYLEWMSQHGGVIINILADMWRGIPGMAHTSVARAGIDNLTKTLSLEWAESGVRVNSVAPGAIISPTARANYAGSYEMNDFSEQIPAWRLGLPEEISAAVCYLLSPAAGFVTGETLKVDGGGSLYGCMSESVLKYARLADLKPLSVAMPIRSIFSRTLFSNKVAIVTGGATGIGEAIASELLYLGCNVMIASRKEDNLRAAAEKMTKNPDFTGKVLTTKCNVRKEDEVENLMKNTIAKFGKIDYLVNNGGGQFLSPAQNITAKGWNAVVETNLTGTFYLCKSAYLNWMQEHGGVIVNMVSDMWKGYCYMAHSSAARAGIDNLTKVLSLEWAESGVRVCAIAPGTVYSPTAAANYGDDKIFDRALALQPTGRLGELSEISAAVCFLLSPGASFVTGETLKVDGAQSLYKSFIEIPKHDNFPVWSWDDAPKSKL